jgi:hypothetical protein
MKNIDLKSYDVYRPTKVELAGIRKGRADFERGDAVTLHQLRNELNSARHEPRKKQIPGVSNISSALVARVATRGCSSLENANLAR